MIDSVSLSNSQAVEDGSFEDPVVSNSQGNPTGTAWNYFGPSGVAHSGGAFLSGSANPPSGSQVAFIANNGWISQDLFIEQEGTYTLSFKAAQISNVLSSQQVRVTLRTAASILSEKTFVWCGDQICEERDAVGANVTKRFFAEGEQKIGPEGVNYYFYTRDHLGSVREAFDQNGKVRARYDYDAYGNRVTVDGELDVSFGFAGYYYHVPSGLNLTMYRAYDPKVGRWISRDPLKDAEQSQGPNLYAYVGNNPTYFTDALGLAAGDWWDPRTPLALELEASRYAETMRGRMGNDSTHHAIAIRDFAERMERVYGPFGATIAAYLGVVYGEYGEAVSPSSDYLQDMEANMEGFWDYLNDVRYRCEKDK